MDELVENSPADIQRSEKINPFDLVEAAVSLDTWEIHCRESDRHGLGGGRIWWTALSRSRLFYADGHDGRSQPHR